MLERPQLLEPLGALGRAGRERDELREEGPAVGVEADVLEPARRGGVRAAVRDRRAREVERASARGRGPPSRGWDRRAPFPRADGPPSPWARRGRPRAPPRRRRSRSPRSAARHPGRSPRSHRRASPPPRRGGRCRWDARATSSPRGRRRPSPRPRCARRRWRPSTSRSFFARRAPSITCASIGRPAISANGLPGKREAR